jgi:hypothetical protein
MTWVLIIFLYIGRGGAAVTNEFNTQQACQAAYDAVLAQRKTDVYGGCFEKGTRSPARL